MSRRLQHVSSLKFMLCSLPQRRAGHAQDRLAQASSCINAGFAAATHAGRHARYMLCARPCLCISCGVLLDAPVRRIWRRIDRRDGQRRRQPRRVAATPDAAPTPPAPADVCIEAAQHQQMPSAEGEQANTLASRGSARNETSQAKKPLHIVTCTRICRALIPG